MAVFTRLCVWPRMVRRCISSWYGPAVVPPLARMSQTHQLCTLCPHPSAADGSPQSTKYKVQPVIRTRPKVRAHVAVRASCRDMPCVTHVRCTRSSSRLALSRSPPRMPRQLDTRRRPHDTHTAPRCAHTYTHASRDTRYAIRSMTRRAPSTRKAPRYAQSPVWFAPVT